MKKARNRIDAHCHLDRAWTAQDRYWKHARLSVSSIMMGSLRLKQSAMGKLHTGLAYEPQELKNRMRRVLTAKLIAGEKEVWAVVDTSPDIGTLAVDTAIELKEEFVGRLRLMVGGYPIFGFKTPDSDRYRLICEVAPRVQFLVGLPERDAREGHEKVGFNGHIRMLLGIAQEHNLPAYIHLDQADVPTESGTETLIEAIRWLGSPKVEGCHGPSVWAVHVISPSCYSEERFSRMVEGLLECNIGVIVCPHAGISMRQIRTVQSPNHNSIARVRELAAAGVPIRLGTDNIGDIFVGDERPDLGREIEMAACAVRHYDRPFWDKIASGEPLDEVDMSNLKHSLEEDEAIFKQYA